MRAATAQHSMLSTDPQVADSGNRILGKRWRSIGPFFVGNGQQAIDLSRVEACQAEIEIETVPFAQLQALQLEGPV